MSGDLFPAMGESLSPKEAWKRAHKIHTSPPSGGDDVDELGIHGGKWTAWQGEEDELPGLTSAAFAQGDDENHAMFNLALQLKLKSWLNH